MATSMASVVGGARVFCTQITLGKSHRRVQFTAPSSGVAARRSFVVRAETINPSIRKEVDKVVDSVEVAELSKPLTAYCRCWRSGTFPLCDGSHVKHNKETGDNVGPLLLKKQKE